MFGLIVRLFWPGKSVSAFSLEEIEILSKPRSREWKKLRSEHIAKNPRCAVCGNTCNVVPHHIVPFHKDPAKELDPDNLISLCEGDTFNCHLFFGHFRNWCGYNPDVAEDARMWNERLSRAIENQSDSSSSSSSSSCSFSCS
jgi:hypothetical protein